MFARLWSFRRLTAYLLAWALIVLAARSSWLMLQRGTGEPVDKGAVLRQVRQVARLTLLEVQMYRKIVFEPDPPAPDGVLHALWLFAANHLRHQSGKVIVFAQGSVGIDMGDLTEDGMRWLSDGTVEVIVPSLWYELKLLPGETEVIASNLTSEQTTALLAEAEKVMLQQLRSDPAIQQKAQQGAEHWLAHWLMRMGTQKVRFVATSQGPMPPL